MDWLHSRLYDVQNFDWFQSGTWTHALIASIAMFLAIGSVKRFITEAVKKGFQEASRNNEQRPI